MLREYSLDTENFRDIMDDAKNMVVSLYPEWTDFNYHDPGIMMLELFSWIKEGQQYYMDQIGEEHRKKYLKLLGESLRPRKQARAYVDIISKEELTLAAGTKFLAGNVVFEMVKRQCIVANEVIECFCGANKLEASCIGAGEQETDHLRMYLFGEQAMVGSSCYIGFREALPVGECVGIFFHLAKEEGLQRNRLTQELEKALLSLSFEYFADGEWRTIPFVQDETFGMMQSGMVYLSLESKMQQTEVFGKRAFYVRLRVIKSDIDLSPMLEKLLLNVVWVRQQNTWVVHQEKEITKTGGKGSVSVDHKLNIDGRTELYVKKGELYFPLKVYEKSVDEAKGVAVFSFSEEQCSQVLVVSYTQEAGFERCIGIGDGFPYQEYELISNDFSSDQICLMVHEIGSHGGYRIWEYVEDFGASKPEDHHFSIDRRGGKVIFGDGEHGMAPEGEILLLSFVETLGEYGNVKKHTINRFAEEEREDVVICNLRDAYGGKDAETIEECFQRTRMKLKHPDTAVTYADYERYVMETPGLMIESCKVIPSTEVSMVRANTDGNAVVIVVKPVGNKEKMELSENYRYNIMRHLERYRMLGTELIVISPRYVDIELCVDISVKPHFAAAREEIRKTVERYFRNLKKQFGATIVNSEIYGILDMLECVAGINDITFDIRDARVRRTPEGNYILPPNGVILLKEVQYIITLAS